MSESELTLRDWGTTEAVPMREGHEIQQITVNPGAKMPLRLNDFQCEHWVIVQGTGRMSLEMQSFLLDTGASTFIPARSAHDIENIGDEPLRIVTVHYASEFNGQDQGQGSTKTAVSA